MSVEAVINESWGPWHDLRLEIQECEGPPPVCQDCDVDDRVLQAAENNARWCDLVCRSHGIPTVMRRHVWAARRRAPEFYPDAVTLRPASSVDEVLEPVEAGRGCSVKDSFASLELDRVGFEELFEARWIYHEALHSTERSDLIWTVIESEQALAEWVGNAGLADAIRGDLLHHPTVRFLAAIGADGLSAGAIANQTGSVVGVSNVFAQTIDDRATWAAISGALATVFPSLPIVGYEHGEALRAALSSGFDEIGALRVWVRMSYKGA